MSLRPSDFDLAALRALVTALREEGVMQFSSPEVSLVLGPKPPAVLRGDPDVPEDPEKAIEDALFKTGNAT